MTIYQKNDSISTPLYNLLKIPVPPWGIALQVILMVVPAGMTDEETPFIPPAPFHSGDYTLLKGTM